MRAVADDHGKRREAQLGGGRAAHHDQGRRAVGNRARIRRGHGAVLAERRLQGRDLLEIGLEGLLVLLHEALGLPSLHGDRGDLPGEPAVPVCGLSALERCDREFVLIFPGEAVLPRAVLGEAAHQFAFVVSILQPVEKHMVDDLLVAHAVTRARFRKQVRRIGHRLHAARDHDFVGAGRKEIVGKHRRLHARAAHLVHCRAPGRQRKPGG